LFSLTLSLTLGQASSAKGEVLDQLNNYDCFHDQGKGVNIPKGFKKIRVHLIYNVKHDGRHKARLVADGHLTSIPVDSVYSGVVTLRGLRLLIFLAELNDLQTWATNIGNAYLEALTSKRCVLLLVLSLEISKDMS
jgi:hypothetical protein